MPEELPKRFSDWFNPYNKDHMRAFSAFSTTGLWPTEFVPSQYEKTCYLESAFVVVKIAEAKTKIFKQGGCYDTEER